MNVNNSRKTIILIVKILWLYSFFFRIAPQDIRQEFRSGNAGFEEYFSGFSPDGGVRKPEKGTARTPSRAREYYAIRRRQCSCVRLCSFGRPMEYKKTFTLFSMKENRR